MQYTSLGYITVGEYTEHTVEVTYPDGRVAIIRVAAPPEATPEEITAVSLTVLPPDSAPEVPDGAADSE